MPAGTTLNGSYGQPYFDSDGSTATAPAGVSAYAAPNGAISAGNDATITVEGKVSEDSQGYLNRGMWAATTGSGVNTGNNMYANAVDFGSGTTVVVSPTGQILTNGAPGAEAINPAGDNNTINNSGLIWVGNWDGQNTGSVAIWLQDDSESGYADNGPNYINNEATGIIGTTNGANGTAIGTEGMGTLDMVNKGTVDGGISLASGDDVLDLYTGSTITGKVDGAGGTNTLVLDGTGSETLEQGVAQITNFTMLDKEDSGTWTVDNALAAVDDSGNVLPLTVDVKGGTLALTDNNADFDGTMTIEKGGTLQLGDGGTTGSLSTAINNSGTVAFDHSNDITYTLPLSGSGAVAQIGTGQTSLSDNNTYTGGTTITGGALQGSVTAFGTGCITDNASLIVAQDTDGTLANTVSGTGTLTKQGTGIVTLLTNDTYTGATTIENGTLQLGNGGITGSIMNTAAIHDNANLTVDHSDAVTLSLPIDGTGGRRLYQTLATPGRPFTPWRLQGPFHP
ncbi:beta strand repeat-containing protein [Komagataeibacter europaeus]|uniref:beta strand repeat-containing protein n=1 Tax=Komagataeibacter europaeus TaxID=33995 RepID=UPI0015FAA98B|nr:autotransporter-associated beta strand repeat-containing protein [Komagataeibacter europaeus]